jgi:glutamine synthetase
MCGFCDLPGVMQHFTVRVESFDETIFSDGLVALYSDV